MVEAVVVMARVVVARVTEAVEVVMVVEATVVTERSHTWCARILVLRCRHCRVETRSSVSPHLSGSGYRAGMRSHWGTPASESANGGSLLGCHAGKRQSLGTAWHSRTCSRGPRLPPCTDFTLPSASAVQPAAQLPKGSVLARRRLPPTNAQLDADKSCCAAASKRPAISVAMATRAAGLPPVARR